MLEGIIVRVENDKVGSEISCVLFYLLERTHFLNKKLMSILLKLIDLNFFWELENVLFF